LLYDLLYNSLHVRLVQTRMLLLLLVYHGEDQIEVNVQFDITYVYLDIFDNFDRCIWLSLFFQINIMDAKNQCYDQHLLTDLLGRLAYILLQFASNA